MLPPISASLFNVNSTGHNVQAPEMVPSTGEPAGQKELKSSISPGRAQNNKPIYVLNGPIAVKEMAERLELKPFKILSDLISMKVFVQNAEKTISEDYQERIATKRGYQVRYPTEEERLQQKIVELRDQFGTK